MKILTENKQRQGKGLNAYALHIQRESRKKEIIHQSLYQFLKHTVSLLKYNDVTLFMHIAFYRLCGFTHAENIAVL